MRILFWTVSHLPDLGGFQWSTLRLAKALKTLGHKPVFLTGTQQECFFDKEIPAIRIPCADIQDWTLKSGKWILDNVASFDVIHAIDLFYKAIDFQLDFMLRSSLPTVIKIPTSGYVPRLINNSIRESFCSINAVIALSDGIKKELIDCGMPGTNIFLIPNGIDTNEFVPATDKQMARHNLQLPKDKVLILFTGRFVHRKRLDILLQVIEKMSKCYHLVMVGSSFGQRDSVEEQILQIAERLENVTALQSTPDVLKYYQACDINVLLAEREGNPNSILEGMSCELATVATDIPGISNVISNGREGILVPVADVYKTTDALFRIGNNQKFMQAMGRLARKRIEEKFAIEIVARAYVDLYNKISKKKGV